MARLAVFLSLLTPLAALHVPLTRRSLLGGVAATALTRPSRASAAPALATFDGSGFTIDIPSSWYRPKGRPRTGLDDTIFAAADYASGRAVSVSRTSALELLLSSGDPFPADFPPPTELKELGKPDKVVNLLVRRRDGDPLGLQPSRNTVVDVRRDGDELLFTLSSLGSTATSMTSARPTARTVQGRAIFVRPPSGEGSSYLLTAWASSSAATRCEQQECDECASLECSCPPPVCFVDKDAPLDQLDQAITQSLRASPTYSMPK
tara:strand:+ start:238 stop:1029 length:792 start_codon:yes stop_codon:yes gene_type:complete